MSRPLNKIAAEILADFGPPGQSQPAYKVWCKPYVKAMLSIRSLDESYGLDPAEDIVVRFLVNASSWRGETAKRVKAELNQIIKENHVSPTR